MRRAAACLVMLLATVPASAHEVRPAYLELTDVAPDTWDVVWKVPARGDDQRLALHLKLPEDCRSLAPPRATPVDGAWIERSRIGCALAGKTIDVEGLATTLTDVLVRVVHAGGATQVARMTPDRPALVVEAEPDAGEIARTYVRLGVEHILTGPDHLLFVLGLVLLVRGVRRVVATVSAFTVAHTATLALATLGVVHVPQAPVEAVIALSIVFVAREVVRAGDGPPSLAVRQPWLVAFAFGLLHGLGFAGGLSAAGLPAGHVPLALAFFSVGVEIGHFAFVAVALAAMAAIRRLRLDPPAWVRLAPGYAIGCLAAFWLVQRIAAF